MPPHPARDAPPRAAAGSAARRSTGDTWAPCPRGGAGGRPPGPARPACPASGRGRWQCQPGGTLPSPPSTGASNPVAEFTASMRSRMTRSAVSSRDATAAGSPAQIRMIISTATSPSRPGSVPRTSPYLTARTRAGNAAIKWVTSPSRTPLNNADGGMSAERISRPSGVPWLLPGPDAGAVRLGGKAWAGPGERLRRPGAWLAWPGPAGQARTQAPPERVRPRRARVRRLIAAHRLCSQASFLAVPM